jgi:hypothetical protein
MLNSLITSMKDLSLDVKAAVAALKEAIQLGMSSNESHMAKVSERSM